MWKSYRYACLNFHKDGKHQTARQVVFRPKEGAFLTNTKKNHSTPPFCKIYPSYLSELPPGYWEYKMAPLTIVR